MLERANKKSYFEDLFYEEFVCVAKEDLRAVNHRTTRSYVSSKEVEAKLNDNKSSSPNERNMTRKTRTRRPRIQAIQSGYCAICSVPYNSVEDHIQSKKHQKLIGEDANYIALNGYIHPDIGLESLLSLTGIDAIGFDQDFSPKVRRRNNMPRTRASSVVSDLAKSSPLSPTNSDYNGHHLRSRRNINYMTPPLEDDSLQEKPDFEPLKLEYKEYRELRSSTRALAKLTSHNEEDTEPEVWNSGRPKRQCISRKRKYSIEECSTPNNKTYYKVEVMSNKPRSTNDQSKEKDRDVVKRQRSPKYINEQEKEKGLIVKFKKLRNTELVQLNNEATNFLFPKKEESSEDEEDGDLDTDGGTTVSSGDKIESGCSLSSDGEDSKTLGRFKVEDEASMDSTCSETKQKRKRRTQAEAFILDNQKYYKFETPGSRLRYQGSYLSPVSIKSPKSSEEYTVKTEREDIEEGKSDKPITNIKLEDYEFSFESVPKNQSWYTAFQRQDKGEQYYNITSNYYWDEFQMPYQMRHIKPLNPRICVSAYKEIVSSLVDQTAPGCSSTTCTNETDNVDEAESESMDKIEIIDEDSKISSGSSTSTAEELEMVVERRRPSRGRSAGISSGKNPRKSPRQHASTLAILSSLIHQRKRRSKNTYIAEPEEKLQVIPEEEPAPTLEEEPAKTPKPRTPKKVKPKIDYALIAMQIEEELDTALEVNEEELDLDISEENTCCFNESRVQVSDIITLYQEANAKETELSCRRFFNGTPGRKPGKRIKNKTGWPTKNKRRRRRLETELNVDESSNGDDTSEEDSEKTEDCIKTEEIQPLTTEVTEEVKPPTRQVIKVVKNKKPAVKRKKVVQKKWPRINKRRINKDKNETRRATASETDEDVRTPTKKPLKRKKNKTGWPKAVRKRTPAKVKKNRSQRQADIEEDDDDSEDSSSIKVTNCDLYEETNRVCDSKVNMQPYVYVKKLDAHSSDVVNSVSNGGKVKTSRRRRRIMPGSPKSPRMLRKPRGRWYRER